MGRSIETRLKQQKQKAKQLVKLKVLRNMKPLSKGVAKYDRIDKASLNFTSVNAVKVTVKGAHLYTKIGINISSGLNELCKANDNIKNIVRGMLK